MRFYLGTDEANWLWTGHNRHPLFVSRRRIVRYKKLQPANTRWALDSGGFTELNMYGRWQTTPHQYAAQVQRFVNEIGQLDWAAPQDWMCEPQVLRRTGLTVEQHQALTVRNYIDLKTISPQLPFIPALQGWHADDYLRHVDMYQHAGIDLTAVPIVGMGTFCRRASTRPVQQLVQRLANDGLNMHGFGVKQDGLPIMGHHLHSSDSMAWSLTARFAQTRLCDEPHRATKCVHCRTWAQQWADRVITHIGTQPEQLSYAL